MWDEVTAEEDMPFVEVRHSKTDVNHREDNKMTRQPLSIYLHYNASLGKKYCSNG
jgi:hypothetical protein